MKENDQRLHCSNEKRTAIRNTIAATRNRRQSQVVKCFELKINERKLNSRQKEQLMMLFVEAKWLYNHVLSIHKNGVNLRDINTTYIKEVQHYNKDGEQINSSLSYLKAQQKQSILGRMISNEKTIKVLIDGGYQTHGRLKFKSELTSIPLVQYGATYRINDDGTVKIAGIKGRVSVHGLHQLESVDEFANANLLHKPDGYYLKVTGYFNKENFPEAKPTKEEIGLDFGIKTNITTSEGERINISVGESEHLKKLQQKLQRQVKGSNNRKRTIQKIRIAYQKQTNKKQDKCNKFIHKMKDYKAVVMQDEQLANWKQTPGMSKVVQHSCVGLIKARLKAMPNVIILESSIPTTKWCPSCGKTHELTLDERQYVCECGRSLDRDLHAAQNMLAIAHLVLGENLVPTEHREIKRVEFLNKSRTMKHEADTL